jgi:hypothetical protein
MRTCVPAELRCCNFCNHCAFNICQEIRRHQPIPPKPSSQQNPMSCSRSLAPINPQMKPFPSKSVKRTRLTCIRWSTRYVRIVIVIVIVIEMNSCAAYWTCVASNFPDTMPNAYSYNRSSRETASMSFVTLGVRVRLFLHTTRTPPGPRSRRNLNFLRMFQDSVFSSVFTLKSSLIGFRWLRRRRVIQNL